MRESLFVHPRVIIGAQLAILFAFLGFVTGFVGWVVHLVRLSFSLEDVPSASMAVSLIAIPVLLLLAGIVGYVILGLVFDPEAREAERQKEIKE